MDRLEWRGKYSEVDKEVNVGNTIWSFTICFTKELKTLGNIV